MGKLLFILATVLLCYDCNAAQVMPTTEIGRVTVQVPLLVNGKPVVSKDMDQHEVASVVEVKPGKVMTEQVVVPPTAKVPLAKVRNMRAIVPTANHGMPNPGIPTPGMPNPGVPTPGMPNPGIETRGMPNPGILIPGMPNPGVPLTGMPNLGIETRGMPNPGIPLPGMPNPGMPIPGMPNPGMPSPDHSSASSEVHPVVAPAETTTSSTNRMASKNCHQLLLASVTTPLPTPPTPVEKCDELCTKLELNPICAYNGNCIHEFPNQCVMNAFNCKHRDVAFSAVDEDICQMGVCAHRCRADDLNM
ncbi:ejaculatory bulb-specific protein 1 [Drosophila grimshawi]|uniref:ejaculatory bulb-specific protein 1 n=1 Tax=Drosophila grimshawi TaxID=7222 RepID=UPI001C936E16|nr:ejaculatory bulb-specific protein 1 [Drosophila grimshawi]